MVFVHGANVDYRYWEPQRAAIAEKYHFIAYSLRYHEPNRWQDDGSNYSVQTHVADLTAFIQSLNSGPVHLVGLSYGGAIAANVAIDHPELVKTLTLADATAASLIADSPEAKPVLAERQSRGRGQGGNEDRRFPCWAEDLHGLGARQQRRLRQRSGD